MGLDRSSKRYAVFDQRDRVVLEAVQGLSEWHAYPYQFEAPRSASWRVLFPLELPTDAECHVRSFGGGALTTLATAPSYSAPSMGPILAASCSAINSSKRSDFCASARLNTLDSLTE